MTEMEEALRSCMEQLVMAREEREQIIVEAANEISSEKKKRRELQHKLDDASKKVVKLAAENSGLCKSVDAKDALIGELRESEAAARGKLADATARLEAAQKQAASLQYEARMLQKELEVRRQEREYDLKSADAARLQQAEHLKRITQLEAECQRLRAMVRKRLPGPAAIAKMRDEVDHHHQQLTPQASPRRRRPAPPSSPRSVTSFTPRTPSPRRSVSEAENYAFNLRAVEDENRALKQALAQRESELQFVQMKYADEACKLKAVQRQLKELTENRQLSDTNCQSESWASALISELEQFRSGNQNGASIMASDLTLLDDFAEIEKMEMASGGGEKKNSPRALPKKVDTGSVTLEQSGNSLVVNGDIPNGNPEKVQDIWELVMHKHESSGESVDTILEQLRHALDQETISTKREDSDVSYNLPEVEKIVRDLIEKLTPMIGSAAEDNAARSGPLLRDNSELCGRLEHLVQVCQDFLHGKANIEKPIDEVCVILKYTLSQYFSNQDQSVTVHSNTKSSDEGESLSTINIEGQQNNETQGAEPATALDIQEEALDEPIQSAESQITVSHQEKLDEDITGCVLGPADGDTLSARKSTYFEIESAAAEGSVEDWAAQEKEQLASNSDILAAADKLAECQETITILSKQLQALAAPATSGPLDCPVFDPWPSSAYKSQSLASILAEEDINNANGSGSRATPKQSQVKKEQDVSCAIPEKMPAREQNATIAEDKDSIQIVVHPTTFAEPRRGDVSADPKKKKRGPSLLGRIMFRKKAEGSS